MSEQMPTGRRRTLRIMAKYTWEGAWILDRRIWDVFVRQFLLGRAPRPHAKRGSILQIERQAEREHPSAKNAFRLGMWSSSSLQAGLLVGACVLAIKHYDPMWLQR